MLRLSVTPFVKTGSCYCPAGVMTVKKKKKREKKPVTCARQCCQYAARLAVTFECILLQRSLFLGAGNCLQDYMTSPKWQNYPPLPSPSYLSDGSLATDPWPGFDLHPIRSTPEGSPIGGLAKGGGGAWGCGETKDSLSKGRLTAHRKLASSWYKPC